MASIRNKYVAPANRVKRIRRGTKQAHVLSLMDTGSALDHIVQIVGVSPSEVKHHVLNLEKLGVGVRVAGNAIQAIYPEGTTLGDCFLTPEAPTAPVSAQLAFNFEVDQQELVDESLVAAGY